MHYICACFRYIFGYRIMSLCITSVLVMAGFWVGQVLATVSICVVWIVVTILMHEKCTYVSEILGKQLLQ